MSDIETTVIALIAKELGEQHMTANRVAEIQRGYMLDEDLGVNSIDRVWFAVALDEHFGIETPDDDVSGWASVADVVASVERLTKADPNAPASHILFHRTQVRTVCEHKFGGWREHSDGLGGEQFCEKCGLGAMAHSMEFLP